MTVRVHGEAWVSRLIGSLRGTSGSRRGPVTERYRRRPYSVVLPDEIEKATPRTRPHPDPGGRRLTDGQGRTVDFRNTIIAMTSNIGSDLILEAGGASGQA